MVAELRFALDEKITALLARQIPSLVTFPF